MMNIAAQIPPRARKVVELGASRERAGEAFLRIQPQAEYYGVVAEAGELREAASCLPHAFCFTPENLDFEALGLYEVDVLIIRGRFLQNLTAERLKKWARVLKPEGQLLLEVPNPAYIRPLLAQLAGKGQLSAGGYGVSEIRQMLKEAGLSTLLVQGSYDLEQDRELINSAENQALLQGLQGLLRKQGWEAAKDRDPWLAWFFFRAVKKPPAEEDKLLIQVVIGEDIVTSRVRIYEPHDFLVTEPGVSAMSITRDRYQGVDEMAAKFPRKVFIRQRLSYDTAEQAFATVESLREKGYLILGEMDDNPSAFLRAYPEIDALSYLATHAIQVSTEPLAEVLRAYNPWVKVFENQLKELPEKRSYGEERLKKLAAGEDYVTFFFGALNRTEEWQDVMPVIRGAIGKYGARLRFKVLSDRGFFDALPTEHKEYIGTKDMYGGQFVPYAMYQEALHSSDISFLPLRDNRFNRTKSDLKFIESAGHGAVVIASPTVYEASVREGQTGFIYRSPEEFRACLELLVENRERRLETARAAYEYVKRERLLADHYLERLAWYREMVSRREELDAAMMKRLKEWQEKYPEALNRNGEVKA
ncbi:MAG: glycosyltransferase [Selenomonas sp.]|nr:glycosyltransferase [Selenomonas sp.]